MNRGAAGFGPWLGRVNPLVADGILALTVFGVSSLLGFQIEPRGPQPFDIWAYLLTALTCLPLAARRLVPVTVLLLSSAAYAIFLSGHYEPSANLWGPVLALYTVASLRPLRIAAGSATIVALVVFYGGTRMPGLPVAIAVAQAVVVAIIALLFGNAMNKLAERNKQLASATAQLHKEQQQRTERAIAEERLRIARELHDVVAHHMSVISVQSGLAGYVFDSDPAGARMALGTIADTSREALEEMRRLLALLRVEPPDTEDQAPRLANLQGMVERLRHAGMAIELTIAGTPRPLPPGLDLCVYRVIQEALTNTLKHAGPCRAELLVDYHPNRLEVTVTDDGLGPPPVTGLVAGHGLIGMRERVRLYHGTLRAGPGAEGGFRVELTLPMPWLGLAWRLGGRGVGQAT